MPAVNISRKSLAWIAVWVSTRMLMVVLVGFWLPSGAHYEDLDLYGAWSQIMVDSGSFPNEELWQYPPGAAFLMLLPRLSFAAYQPSFLVLLLVCDLIGLWLMARLAKEEKRDVGVWIWLIGIPLLATIPSWNGLPLLRFDLVPTVMAMGGLLVIHRRPNLFGALAGLGAMLKVWPAFLLFGEWDRGRLRKALLAAAAVVALIFAVSALSLGNPFKFLTEQEGRGLQVEAVGALPWKIREVITGKGQYLEVHYGSNEIATNSGNAVAKALGFAALIVMVGAAAWWRLRDRAIRNGRRDLADVALSRDFVFTVSLLFIVVSRVLSPQYMIWLVGLCAIVLTSRGTRIARAAWLTVLAIVLTTGVAQAIAISLVTRNLVLLYAAIDASVVLMLTVLNTRSSGEQSEVLADDRDRVAAQAPT